MSAPSLPDAGTWRDWGVDPAWSRTIDVPCADGIHRWHLLDTDPSGEGRPTIVCVHGNPTWSYAWVSFLAALGSTHRVIAVDQLGMGFSDRVPPRRYADRVRDLGSVLDALGLGAASPDAPPIVLAAHDWGGAIAMGWAVEHTDRVAAMVLCNTGIAVPEGRSAPRLISTAASRPLRRAVCELTPTFVEGTIRLSGDSLDGPQRAAFRAPYRRRADRSAIADFVGDVPLTSPHPSEAALAAVAERLPSLDVPVLLAWGSADPVFDDDFAADLAARLPDTRLHRWPTAGHLVMAEADVAGAVELWLHDLDLGDAAADSTASTAADAAPSLWSAIEERAASSPDQTALADEASGRASTWRELHRRVEGFAAALRDRGVAHGDRVSVLVPPGVEQIALVYGIWRAGAVPVLADRGLGLRGLGRAVRGARVAVTVGDRRARLAARVMRWSPGSMHLDVDELVLAADAFDPAAADLPDAPGGDDLAAVLFTSGATGPAKGVRYTHAQLAAQRTALATTYGIRADDRLVAAFAPFALYGPALGIPTALPDCDVTAPGSLTAEALGAAVERVGATLVFASPAALANVVATADSASEGARRALAGVRTLMSAGAPVPSELLRQVAQLAPEASLHTPYGMTEILPVADVDLATIERAESAAPAAGVCVGRPVDGAEVMVVPLGFDPADGVPEPLGAGRMGELLVRAPWRSAGYLDLWETERRARPGDRWHRTGDVGHLDDEGLLWVEGRAVHVVHTVDGPQASVPLERAVESAGIDGVRPGRVAAVGVGPAGVQQLVVVVERPDGSDGLADPSLAEAVRRAVPVAIAAVLVMRRLPVDIRHNAKIDRAAVADWAADLLAGAGGGA